jgi:hypothetical protein
MPQVVYHRLIDRDIRCALNYYESEGGSRLADRFFADVQATVEAIKQNPTSHHFSDGGLRRLSLSSFSYHFLSAFSFLVFALASAATESKGAIALVAVYSDSVRLGGGSDFFTFSTANGGTDYFFGGPAGFGFPERRTFFRADPEGHLHYFQVDTILPSSFVVIDSQTRAYWFSSRSSGGARPGINFSVYDLDQDLEPDIVFQLDLGPDLNDPTDDRIISYAHDLSRGGIDVAEAVSLLVPEPSSALLSALGCISLLAIRRARSPW